jgi:hypothetical protein
MADRMTGRRPDVPLVPGALAHGIETTGWQSVVRSAAIVGCAAAAARYFASAEASCKPSRHICTNPARVAALIATASVDSGEVVGLISSTGGEDALSDEACVKRRPLAASPAPTATTASLRVMFMTELPSGVADDTLRAGGLIPVSRRSPE